MAKKLSKVLQEDQQHCLLTTFRKNGKAVLTPMWFVLKDGVVWMSTRGESGKVKRIRGNGKVKLGPCTAAGRLTGEEVCARASLVSDEAEQDWARQALLKKYGLKKRLVVFAMRFARDKTEAIIKVERQVLTNEA